MSRDGDERDDAGPLAHALSHELRSSLSAASYSCELIRARTDDAKLLEYVERIDQALSEAGSLLTGFVEYADAVSEPLERGPVDLGGLLDEAARQARAEFEGAEVELASEGWPTIPGDPAWLGALFLQLLRNALAHGAGDEVHARVSAERDGDRWLVRVDDRGPGIDSADHDRIFGLFESGGGRGAGVGLALCRVVARRHGGRIRLGRAPEGGARFVVELPAADR